MNIADLFVKIGIAGGEKSAREVEKVDSAIDKMKKTSLEMKLAITGAFYSLQKMASSTLSTGSELTRFSRITGMSTKEIQQLTRAGEQFNTTSEETKGSIQAWQKMMSAVHWEGDALEGLNMISSKLYEHKGIELNMKKFKSDFQYALQYIQEYMTLDVVSQADKNHFTGKLGWLSEGMTQAMSAGAFSSKNINSQKYLSDKQIKIADKADKDLKNIMKDLDAMISQFVTRTAPDLLKLLQDLMPFLQMATDATLQLVSYLKDNAIGMASSAVGNGIDKVFDSRDKILMKQAEEATMLRVNKLRQDRMNATTLGNRSKAEGAINSSNSNKSINTSINSSPTYNIKSTDPKESAKEIEKINNKQVRSTYTQMSAQGVYA